MKRDKYGFPMSFSLFKYRDPLSDCDFSRVYGNRVEHFSWKPRFVHERYGFGFVWLGWHVVYWPRNDMKPVALYHHPEWVEASRDLTDRTIGTPYRELYERRKEIIPHGIYCHSYEGGRSDVCPFWDIDDARPYQDNGYCHLLHSGDWSMGGGLLWDQCKECSYNGDDG